jgi:hypothetical protein|eukprot:COSAG01_NODE_3949_length_5502_cov_53.650750_1_plen_70_part_00
MMMGKSTRTRSSNYSSTCIVPMLYAFKLALELASYWPQLLLVGIPRPEANSGYTTVIRARTAVHRVQIE